MSFKIPTEELTVIGETIVKSQKRNLSHFLELLEEDRKDYERTKDVLSFFEGRGS